MGVLFLGFASLQFNDLGQYGNADSWSWVLIYLIAALLSVLPLWVRVGRSLIAGFTGFSLGAFVFRMQDHQGNFRMEKFAGRWLYNDEGTQMVQQTNEAGGLFIVFLWMFVLYFLNQSAKTKTTL